MTKIARITMVVITNAHNSAKQQCVAQCAEVSVIIQWAKKAVLPISDTFLSQTFSLSSNASATSRSAMQPMRWWNVHD